MGYYYIGEDGYKRRFDDEYNFIPDENVVAFEAGAAFDWSKLERDDDSSYSVSKKTTTTKTAQPFSSSTYKKAEEYAEKIRSLDYEKGYKEIYDNLEFDATEAFVNYKKDASVSEQNSSAQGLNNDVSSSNAIYEAYQRALKLVNLSYEKQVSDLNERLDNQYQSDYNKYLNALK